MQPASTEVLAAGIRVGTPTPEQAAKQREFEIAKQKAEIAQGIERIDHAVQQLDTEKFLREQTGSPTPNRAQRRAAEKRLRRQGRRS